MADGASAWVPVARVSFRLVRLVRGQEIGTSDILSYAQ